MRNWMVADAEVIMDMKAPVEEAVLGGILNSNNIGVTTKPPPKPNNEASTPTTIPMIIILMRFFVLHSIAFDYLLSKPMSYFSLCCLFK